MGAATPAIASVWCIDRYLRSRIHYRIRLYDTAGITELPQRFERGHGSIVNALAFSPAGDTLAKVKADGTYTTIYKKWFNEEPATASK